MLRDVEWATNNCTLTFTSLGIWPENADGTDVNYCDRSHNMNLLATGDDFGKVKLFSYPVVQPKVRIKFHFAGHVFYYFFHIFVYFQSLCHVYGGHSSHVTAVKFLHDDSRLVSIGGKDTAVLQWTVS